jgi:molecular chaperone HscB
MTYFELYQEAFSLQINTAQLKRKYYELSRQYHPDHVSLADADAQEAAMKMSTQINEAWKTLSDVDLRLKYILTLKNIIAEAEEFKLSNNFLMQMMDVNESIADAKLQGNATMLNSIHVQIEELKVQLKQSIQWALAVADLHHLSESEANSLKQYYYQSKYLRRLQQQLQDKAPEM